MSRFGGFIARYVGDGVLVYFGWPEAREADAESAVRAALAVADAIGQSPIRAESLQVRIGIASGLVVVGEPIGTGEARQQTAIGETPNLVARLQGLAEANGVVIDAVTRRQIGGLFDCRSLGTVAVKGLPEPVSAWQVLGEAGVENRFEALRAGTMVPLIGRDEELDVLRRRWAQVRAGQGRIVMISGEPGIGKSRLLAAFEEKQRSNARILRYFCSPHHQDSPLHPVIRQLELAAAFARDDTPEDRVNKLRRLLAGAPEEDVALLAALLLLPTSGLSMPNLSPNRRKERTYDALIGQIRRSGRERPVLLLFEDVHWADPSTLDFLHVLIRALATLRSLVLTTFRPEFTAPWIGHAGATLITLGRLDRDDAASLARQMTCGSTLPHELLSRVVAQSDGIPLFIEELTKAVAETAPATFDSSPIAVPTTLQASLLARLDRIPVAKQIAQIGAVIGREFSHTLVSGVARVSDARLAQGLDELVESGLVFRRGQGLDAVYSFKHALVQDVAYESLLRSRRTEIHSAIVTLSERDSPAAGIEPGILAHHCAQAGLIAQAASYYRIAGERSAERLIAEETKTQFERGLQFAESLSADPDRYRLEAELLIALGRVLLPTMGQAHPETRRVLERAAAICRESDNGIMLARALYALGIVEEDSGNARSAQTIGEELLALSERTGDIGIGIAGRARLGPALRYQGRFTEARDTLSEAVNLFAQGTHELLDVAVSSMPDVPARAHLANTLAYLGYADQAIVQAEHSIRRARQLGPTSLVFAFSRQLWTYLAIRDEARCRETAEMVIALAEEQGIFRSFLANARCVLGWITAKEGRVTEGLSMLTESTRILNRLGSKASTSIVGGLMSDALAWSGQGSDAMAALDEALAVSANSGAAWLDAELHRRKAELMMSGGDLNATSAEGELIKAIDIARSQSAKLLELRASIGLARLLYGHRRRDEAHALLSPIYNWFTEGHTIPDLTEARLLLAELAATPT